MPYCQWDDENWETLIHSIQQRDCILMLGPDAAVDQADGQPRLLGETLARQLADRITVETRERIDASDLAQVCQHYYLEQGRMDLEARVCSFYQERQERTSGFHQDLAALPFYFTVTTTPDRMFYQALLKENKGPVMGRYNFNGQNPGNVEMGTEESPLVFYLYGTVDEPASLLLTENDLLDFLVALISARRPLPDSIYSEMQLKNKIFLFLGFGFRHWYLRILLHVLQGRSRDSRSFALEQVIPKDRGALRPTVFFFKKSDYKIHIFNREFDQFARELREKYPACPAPPVRRPVGEGAPEVFICYASEDRERAGRLYRKLEEAGLKPWRDREKLRERGGEEWNRVIEAAIREVDYFVVLQSEALAQKTIGYVNREIHAALDRLKEFRGRPFIVPVRVEACPLLEELKHLQTIDLGNDDGMGDLISTIKKDFARRGQ